MVPPFPGENPFYSLERAADHTHPHPFPKIGMGVIGKDVGHEFFDRFDFVIRNRFGFAGTTDNLHHAGGSYNGKMIFPGKTGKAITWKEGEFNLFFPVFPVAHSPYQGEKRLDPFSVELITDMFFMT